MAGSETRPLGAQISHMLKDRGVTHIFGIPGVHNQEMYRGIEEAGLTHILARHEQGAGFMADGYARATGRPGVCYVITGPGLCNVMTPLGQAYSDSVPVLCISSCLDETAATRGQLHQMKDQRAAAETVCDWSEEARTAEAAYALIDRALMEFDAKRARPKHIQVPISVLQAPARPARAKVDFASEFLIYQTDLDQSIEEIRASRKPVLIFGGGILRSHASSETYRLAHRLGAVVFETYAGRGCVHPSYPLYLGSSLARPSSQEIFKEADLVISVGTDLAEVDLWRQDLGQDCPHIAINIDIETLGPHRRVTHPVHQNALSAMIELIAAFPEPRQTDWSSEIVQGLRDKWRAEVDMERPGIVPVCDALQEVMPEEAMIYSDMTQFAYAAKEVWEMPCPGHWHHPTGFGTLGYALPAAIGGAVARPGLPTMAIMGDYGFQYTMMELATAVELGLSLPILIWDNGKLGEIEDSMTRAQIAPNAVIQQNPDFLKLAESFGAYGVGPSSLSDLKKAVLSAFEADRPTLIRVPADIAR